MTRLQPERIRSYRQDVLDAAQWLQASLRPQTKEALVSEQAPSIALILARDSVVRRLEIIGQALHKLRTAGPEYARQLPLDVSGWRGLRSKTSQGDDSVDYALL